MANVTLKINKQAYEAKITMLQGYLNKLDSTITQYETLERNMDRFVDGKDDSYDSIKKQVQTNINTVRKAREMTDASIKMLQETLQNVDDMAENVKGIVTEGADLAKNTIKTAVEAMKMIN